MKVSPKDVLLKWVQAYNDRNAEAASALYHDDAYNLQIAIGSPLLGKNAIFQQLKDFFENVPDNYTHIENLFEDGE